MDDVEKHAGITKVENGFIVNLDGKTMISSSLSKAIKLVKDFLLVGVNESFDD